MNIIDDQPILDIPEYCTMCQRGVYMNELGKVVVDDDAKRFQVVPRGGFMRCTNPKCGVSWGPMICPTCKVQMTKGIAIEAHDRGCCGGMGGHTIKAKDVKVIEVLKCHKCGYSWDDKDEERAEWIRCRGI